LCEEPPNFSLNRRELAIEQSPAAIHYNHPTGRQSVELQADSLSEPPLHSITDHCLTQSFGDCETNLRPGFLFNLLKAEGRKERAGETRTLVIDFTEVATAKNSEGLRKGKLGQWPNPPDDPSA
jgi:hypothetical protein